MRQLSLLNEENTLLGETKKALGKLYVSSRWSLQNCIFGVPCRLRKTSKTDKQKKANVEEKELAGRPQTFFAQERSTQDLGYTFVTTCRTRRVLDDQTTLDRRRKHVH